MISPELEREARSFYRHRCANCGSDARVAPRYVVPLEHGGQPVVTNVTFLCRGCDMRDRGAGDGSSARYPVNVWVSRTLHEWVKEITAGSNASSLMRALVSAYVEAPPERFDDLAYYQDLGTDVRLFVYLYANTYGELQARAAAQNLTVTDVLTGLLTLYRVEALRLPPFRTLLVPPPETRS